MATELGTAYVSIVAETSKLEEGIKSALQGGGKQADLVGRDIGKRISATASKAMKDGWRPDQDLMAGIPDTKLDHIGARIGQVIGKGVVIGLRARQAGATFGNSFAEGAGSVGLGGVIARWHSELSGGGAMRAMGMVAGKTLSAAVTAGVGVAAAGIGMALTKGFERLEKIDAATVKLQQMNAVAGRMGKPLIDVKGTVNAVKDSVSGTPFSLDAAFNTAVMAIGAGSKDIGKFMKDVTDAAGFAGTDLDRMGGIFVQVLAKGKLQGDELMQLMEAGLPAKSWIEESYNMTSDQFDKMQQKGQITMDMLQKSIEDHAGGMAKAAGDTLTGAIDNMQTAIARLGADFLGALFGGPGGDPTEGMKQAVNRLTQAFNNLDGWINAHRDDIKKFFDNAKDAAGKVIDVIGGILNILNQIPGGVQTAVVAFAAFETIKGIASVTAAITGLNGALGATAGLAAAALGPLAAIAAIIAGGAIGGASYGNLMNSLGGTSTPAGRNAQNAEFSPGFGIPGAASAPIFQPSSDFGGAGAQRQRRGRAMGGAIAGAGSATSDSIPAMLSNGEHVLTASDVHAMGGQGAVYNFRRSLHLAQGGAIGPTLLKDMRTAGYIPAAAGDVSKAGSSGVAKMIGLGGEAINALIDQAASAAATGASLGADMVGAGPAAGAASQFAIGLASSTAKRGVKYGFDMLGIGADALLQQLTPFGMPRWLTQDYTGFMPNWNIQGGLTDKLGAGSPDSPNAGNGVDPATKKHGTAINTNPGPIDDLMGSTNPTPPDMSSMFDNNANSFLSTELAAPEAPAPDQQPMFKVDNIYTTDAESVGRELTKRGRLAQMQYATRPGV